MKILLHFFAVCTLALFALQLTAQDNAKGPTPDFMPYLSDCASSDRGDRTQCSNKQLLTFIYNHTKYPKEAKDKQEEGMVVITFTVDAQGQMSDLTLLKKTSPLLDEEAMRVMRAVQKELQWSPAIKDGKTVKSKMTIPIKFKLTDSEESDQ